MTDLSLHDALALSLLPLETRRRVAGMLHAAYLDGFTEACRLCDGDDALWTEATHELAAEHWYDATVLPMFKINLREAA